MKSKIWKILFLFIITINLTACGGQEQKEAEYECKISIECSTILRHRNELKKGKEKVVPENGIILEETKGTFYEGESVYDVLKRVCRENDILMEASFTAGTGSAYIEGISNLYEFDCGELSGWEYSVNGDFSNESCSDYKLKEGDIIAWRYTCDLGNDLQ